MSSANFLPSEDNLYVDPKRYIWLASLIVPLIIFVGPALYFLSGEQWVLWIPVGFFYIAVPVLDFLIGEDETNPPESAVPQLEEDRYYRYVTYALVPLLWGAFIFCCWFVGSQELTWSSILAMGISGGGICGFGLNLGHEMGHKQNPLEKFLARFVLSIGAYAHFSLEHNRGHHRDVATPEDSASSRMGETIYRFLLREMPGGFTRAWGMEVERLGRKGESTWSYNNEILRWLVFSMLVYVVMISAFGAAVIPFIIITVFWGAFQLTSANYIEHYGLLRKKLENGNYERCEPHHSWNSNHSFSNWIVFHLQRHSDHHANPSRRYQSLRNFDDLPSLPNGYYGMFVLAYIPQLWFRVMDPKVIEIAGGDIDKINVDPVSRDALQKRYSLKAE